MNTKVLTLGELIRTLRNRSKLSQSELAKCVGVHFTSISRWEHDLSLDNMKVSHFLKIAQATNSALYELLEASKRCGDSEDQGKLIEGIINE